MRTMDPHHDLAAVDATAQAADVDEEIEAFWLEARVRAKLNRLHAYAGPNPAEALRPPAWAFGDSPEQADRLLAKVLDGTKTATSSALRDYEQTGDPLPVEGGLSILTDGVGRPWALLLTTDVRQVPFGEIDDRLAHDEGEDGLESWRRHHQVFFEPAGDVPVTADLPVVVERFRVVWARDTG